MKKNLLVAALFTSALLGAQTPFNANTDYVFANFENGSAKILDEEGVPTDDNAIRDSWNTGSGGAAPALSNNPLVDLSTINSSAGTLRYGIAKDKINGGIYVNIESLYESLYTYKSLRFKMFVQNEEGINATEIGLKVTAGQFNAKGGIKSKIDSIPVTFDNDWIEFSFDISKLKSPSEITNGDNPNPYQYIDISCQGLPIRTDGYSKYFRIDDIIFSKKETSSLSSINNEDALIVYDPQAKKIKVAGDTEAASFYVFNQLGQVCLTAKQASEVSLGGLSKGIYVVQTIVGTEKQTLKICI